MTFADYRGDGGDDLDEALAEKLASRHIHHLYDILAGDSRPLEFYYGEDSSDFGDGERLAEQLTPRFNTAIEQVLELRDNHFQSKINRTAIVDYLEDEGVDPPSMEPLKDIDLLFAAYDTFYDPSEGQMPEADVARLVARGTIFEDRKDRIYRYEGYEFDLANMSNRIKQFRLTYGTQGRHFDIWVYEDEEKEQVALHLFRERPRQVTYRFKSRVDDDEGEADSRGSSRVTTTPIYRVKAIKIRLRNEDDAAVLGLSKGADRGWENDLEALMKEVFNVTNALSEEYQHTSDKVDEIVTGAIEVAKEARSADDENADAPDVEEWLDEKIDATTEETVEQITEDDDVDESEVEQIREIAESIEPTGLRYEGGDVIRSFDLTADPSLSDVMERRLGARDLFTDLLSEADADATVGIEFRAELPNGNIETFLLQDGQWLPDGGLSDEMSHVLNTIYDDNDPTDN